MGADKVLLFFKSVNEKGRMTILSELEDDEGAYGLTKDWNEVEWVCRQHDARQSATTRPASGGEERAASDYALPSEKSSTQTGLEELDIELLVREAYEIVKAQVEAEEGDIEDGPYAAAGREPDGEMREGVEQATLSPCGEGTAMEAGNYGFGTWRPETSSGEETRGSASTLHMLPGPLGKHLR